MNPRTTSRAPSSLRSLRAVASAALLALMGGCMADDEASAPLPDDESVPLEIERDGQIFEWLAPLTQEDDVPEGEVPSRLGSLTPEPIAVDEIDEVLDPRPLSSWSRDELADALRPVIATADGLYIAQEPAWDVADAVLSGDREPHAVDVLDRSGEGRPDVTRADETVFRQIIGSDGRWKVNNTLAAPFDAIAKIKVYSGNTLRKQCTGAYIGPWTFVTAGSCLVYDDNDYANRIVFEAARNGNNLPFGTKDCRLDDGNASNDYLWAVPANYMLGQSPDLDFAVIDTFPCHAAPAWFDGYQVNAGDASYTSVGYPVGTCPGAPGPGNYQCGVSGATYANGWRQESAVIDATEGHEGSPWYGLFGGTTRPMGFYVDYIEYHDFGRCGFDVCRRNIARRIDNTFSNFIIVNAYDF